VWTRDALRDLIETRLKGFRLICVTNREPYIHVRTSDGVRCIDPVSGVVSALDPALRATGGTWIAHGSGSADRETSDSFGLLRVPPEDPRYLLRRIWLNEREETGYYYGFSNEGLWPLCHIAYQRPVFERNDWEQYRAVNARFADAVVEEAGGARALVFIHDYHFALLPKLVKDRLPGAVVFQFWHIPWPNPEAFRILPWAHELLEGLLGNDLLSFHIQHHCNNFIDTVDREIESRIDRERFTVTLRGSPTLIRPQPIGVDFEEISRLAAAPEVAARADALRREVAPPGARILVGIDRLDYTKGIPERLRAFDRLLRLRPEHAGRVVLLQIGVPTRSRLGAYRRLEEEVDGLVAAINARHGTRSWTPVRYSKESRDRDELLPYYRAADVCLVTSLHDGMNLVAKEFVAARTDHRGVLLLSRFTGSARELDRALLVNPFAVDELADAFHVALAMPPDEQESRLRRLRDSVREENVFKWVAKLLSAAARLEPA
jgi:trehalose 6-phosphate synthase